MGRPLDPHSAPAPAGTTTIPGLIPDLITRLPCELWDSPEAHGDGGPGGGPLLSREAPQLLVLAPPPTPTAQGPAGQS